MHVRMTINMAHLHHAVSFCFFLCVFAQGQARVKFGGRAKMYMLYEYLSSYFCTSSSSLLGYFMLICFESNFFSFSYVCLLEDEQKLSLGV